MTFLIDNTIQECYERCEQEASYRYRDHLDSGRPSAALHFGKAVHAGIYAFYDDPWNTDRMLDAVVASWGSAAFDAAEWRTLDYARAIVAAYAAEYPPSKWDFEVVMNETYLENGEECGIVDRVVRRKVDRQLYVLDLKTSGWYPSAAWQEQWRHSQQAARYLDLVAKRLQAQPAGFWCDAIYTNKRCYPKSEDFVRAGPFQYSEALRTELADHRAMKRARMLDVLSGMAVPTKNTKSCYRFQALCPFFRFCWADPNDRNDMIELALATDELVIKEWKPAERVA